MDFQQQEQFSPLPLQWLPLPQKQSTRTMMMSQMQEQLLLVSKHIVVTSLVILCFIL